MTGVFGFTQRAVFGLGTLLLMTGMLCAQESPAAGVAAIPHIGVPEDWSTSHVIYTRNASIEDMMKVRDDPRFLNNTLLHYMRERRSWTQASASAASTTVLNNEGLSSADAQAQELQGSGQIFDISAPPPSKNTKVDWAVSLGPTSGMAFGESPAKYTFNPSAPPSCSDFVVFTIGADGAVGSQANLIGLTNLYTNAAGTGYCPGTGPKWLFSYAIGTGLSDLSPVLSLDGTKVAWLENRGGNTAYLHVTTFVAGQGTNATTGAVAVGAGGSSDIALSYTNATVTGCTAKLETNGDSDLYVDYASGNAFVGADNGNLYHVKGIFSGNPTLDFCIPVNTAVAANAMSGAVYDALLNEVFITDSKTIYAYTVGATSFTLAASYVYGNGSPNDTGPGPLLDAFNGYIYLFTTHDKNGNTSMVQLPTSLASAVFVTLGPASTNDYLFYGTPDNNYYTYGPTNAKATIYSCGTDSTTTTAQDLFAIGFLSTGLANTTPVMPANKNVNPGGKAGYCSPITEFYDGSTDRIFVGVGDNTATTGANVVQMWNVTTQLTSASDTPTASASPYLGGSTGFTIDNNATGTSQAESVYFSTLAKGATATCGANLFCAVKLTQSGLQ